VRNLRDLQSAVAQQALRPFAPAALDDIAECAVISLQDPVQGAPVHVEHARYGFCRTLAGIQGALHEMFDLGHFVARIALFQNLEKGVQYGAEFRIRPWNRMLQIAGGKRDGIALAVEMYRCAE
jgi:hypothetical protein